MKCVEKTWMRSNWTMSKLKTKNKRFILKYGFIDNKCSAYAVPRLLSV